MFETIIFSIAKVFWSLVQPSGLIALALIFGLVFRSRPLARRAIQLVLTVMIVLAFVPLDRLLVLPLESRFAKPDPMPENVAGIIQLGGAIDPRLSAQVGEPALGGPAERVTQFVVLARRYPEAKLLFTGGTGHLLDQEQREADWTRKLYQDMGISTEKMIFERDSRNTAENAKISKEMIQPKTGEIWLLVTSARHMPRSIGVFREIGWEVVAYPVDYTVPPDTQWSLSMGDPLQRLVNLDKGLYEWFGLLWYALIGKSSALFPAP